MYKQSTSHISLKNTGLDVMQSHPLRRMCFSQYPGLNRCFGVTVRWGLLSHAWLATGLWTTLVLRFCLLVIDFKASATCISYHITTIYSTDI